MGPDCAQISCLALRNCSRNGYCIAPNVCKCFDGWQHHDCSEPTCHLVNNCTGHGTCVSLNECNCDPMFTGVDCSKQISNCSSANCNNHGLCINSKCVCETGWTGQFCSRALCDQLNNCSGSGTCIRPQVCECFHGFAGDDCSIFEGPTRDFCDAKCIHGHCNSNTRTCICRDGWTGQSCDICAVEKCDVMSVVLYVLPTAAGIHQKGKDILVYGNDLPFVPSKRYTCLYGSTASDGFYVSSSLVRCTIPSLALPGRYLFNIIPYGSDKAVPFLDKRLIHFTLYNECNQADCKGYCLGAICVCPIDRDGPFCDQTKIRPKLDREILSNEKLTKAVEGEPYTVKMPVQQENTIFNVETDAHGMIIYPNGMVFWAQPIGRVQPYTVNVTAASLTGGFAISWNLTVKPMYTPVITKVESADDSNMKIISGVVNCNTKLIGKVPVKMLVYQDGKLVANATTTSKSDGRFRFEYYPFDETISTSVVVVHPGAAKPDAITSSNNATWAAHNFDIEYAPKIKMKPGEQIDEEYQLKNKGEELLLNCQLELIIPRDKVQIAKYEKIVKGITIGESKSMKVTFAASSTLDGTTLILQFKCIDTPKKLISQQIEVDRERPIFASYPSEILISTPPRIPPKIITVNIINKEGYRFVAAPRISIQPDHSPLFLVSTKPLMQNIMEFSSPGSMLTLFLSYRLLLNGGTVNWTTAGDLILFDGNKRLFTIEYFNYATSDLFDFQITVMDELSVLDPTHVVSDAEIMLRNDILGYDDKRKTKPNEPVVFFSIIEGTYQLTVKSPTHVSVTMIVQPSFINSSLVVFAPITSPYSPVVEDGRLLLEEIDEQRKVPFPKLHFTPSTILVPVNGTKEVKLLISSDSNGPSDHTAFLPSVEIHEEHLPFTFATADLRNGLGLGDGYYMKCKLSRVSNQAVKKTPCTVFALQIPYIYTVPTSISNYARDIVILADNRNKTSDKVHLCEVGLQIASKEASIWTKTTIYCNCAMKTKERCRRQYVSAATCGTAWKYIPDDTVSLQTTAMFIVFMAECRTAGVDFHKIRQFLACASSLDSHCPVSQERHFTKNRSSWESQQRTQFFDQLAMVSAQADEILQKYFPVLKVMASQTVDTVALFNAFFERLNDLLPFKYFDEINDRQWFDKFFESISESSEDGLAISETEFRKLKDEKGGAILAHYWNSTVVQWSTISSLSSKASFTGMKFTDARELIVSSDRLKTLTRQYGADNPFALLHEYMGRLLSWPSENISGSQQILTLGKSYEDICAYAYSLIAPEKPYENSEFHIRLKVINKKNEPLESVKVTLEMIQSGAYIAPGVDTTFMQFRIGAVTLDGIGSIDRASKLPPNASFVAIWSLKPVKNMRLIRETEYQAVVILKFTQNGRRSVQRIATQTVTFRPRPSLKIYYFISNLTRSENAKNVNTSLPMFNVMIAFMNTGYSNLKNVKVEEIRLSVLSADSMKNFLTYRISGIISGIGIENRTLSDLHFIIANIESGKTRGVIRDLKMTTSMNGELIELEDTQTFTIQQFISPTKFLVSLQTNSALLFYYDMQRAAKEKSGSTDGKPFRQQTALFRFSQSQQQLTSFYGRIPYPADLEHEFEVLRVNQVGENGMLKLVDPRYIWSSNTDPEFVHFIDDNPSGASESIAYEIIYGNAELFLRPRFEFPIYNIPLVTENWPHVGDEIARIQATSASQSTIRYELYSNFSEMDDYFSINPETGIINLRKEMLPIEIENSYCATVRAIDDHGRSETIAVTIGFDGFVRECHKIDNFSGLQSLTHIPLHSRSSKPVVEIGVTNDGTRYTSEIPQLYFSSYVAASSLSSTLPSTTAKINEAKNDGYRVTSSVTKKHGYTKLIATQSISDSNRRSDLTLGSIIPLQLPSSVASGSRTNPESDLSIVPGTSSPANAIKNDSNDTFFFTELGTTNDTNKSVSFSTGRSYRTRIIGSTNEGMLLPREEIHSESDRTNEGGITWSDSFSSGSEDESTLNERKGRLWYSTGQQSDVSSTTKIDPYSIFTVGQSRISLKSGVSTVSFINRGADDSSGTTEDSDISSLTEKDVSNEGSEKFPNFYSLFSTEASVEKGLFSLTTLAPRRQIIQYTESSYNFSTANTIYFYLPSGNLEVELPSSENNRKSIITGVTRNDGPHTYQPQVTSLRGSTYYSLISPTLQITELSEQGNAKGSNIQPATKIPVILSSDEISAGSEDKENISEMACRLKDTQPIWSLICDLSKTSSISGY
ncbi:tenascin [Loa loa]|uniref:Tenascin n=1 Tax=Loa loa TaxID=7209 RepID=A0A1S0UMU7_LOALO|nr:tenascin [Loa loa]EJD76796.1 tenascin [Loa loa]